MKRLWLGFSLASALIAQGAFSQEESVEPTQVQESHPAHAVVVPAPAKALAETELTPGQMSPEMYLYLQEQKRHDDPKQAVRRKAEARTAARMARIEAMNWYGMSNARPQANPVPFMASYSPSWVGGGYDPYNWMGGAGPSIIVVYGRDYRR